MLTGEQLLAPKTQIVDLKGFGQVKIKKLKLFEINPHNSKKETEITKTYRLISVSMVEPTLTPEEVKYLDFEDLTQIQNAVLDFNGMSEEGESDIVEK